MKRLTESQIRQVIREELVGLLNEIQAYERYPEMAPEQLRNHGEYLGSITVDELIKVLRKLPTPHTVNQFNFMEISFDKNSRSLLGKPVYIFKSNLGEYYSFYYYDGDGFVNLTLSPSQVTGPYSGRFETKSNDFIFREIQSTYPNKVRKPYKNVTTKSNSDAPANIAGLPSNLRSLHGMTEQQLRSLIKKLISNR